MDHTEKIIDEINGTLAIENMPLTREDREMLRKCITGESTAEEERRRILRQYSVVPKR